MAALNKEMKMALTKKLAKEISVLINDITVCKIMMDSAETKYEGLEKHENIAFWRGNHDRSAAKLNEILGQEAVVPYTRNRDAVTA